MTEEPLKIGLIGYGLAGKVFHTPLYKAANVQLVAVASSDSDKVHADHPDVRVHSTPTALINDSEVELVVLASPSYTHSPLMLESLAAGKHVLSDKPFTATVKQADEVIAAAEVARRIDTCYQNRRYDADFLTLRQLMDDGQLGEVLHYEARFDRFNPAVGDRWQETEQPGVGIHYDLGAHIIDQALVLFGMPDWVQGDVQKQREGSGIIDSFQVRMGIGPIRIDLAAGLLVADHDLRYRVHGTRGSWVKHHLDPQEEQIWHLGMTPQSEGYGLEEESHYGTLTQVDNGHSICSRTPTLKGDWSAYYRELSAAIRHGSAPPVTAHQARNTISVIEAMIESSRTGKRITPQ
jgi:scyllo-inositol 2-dehydrogenase (NADP+)